MIRPKRRRWGALLGGLLGAVVMLGCVVPDARAQWGDSYEAPEGYRPVPRGRIRDDGYGDPRARSARRYAPPQEETRQFYWPWEDRPKPAPQQVQPEPDGRAYQRPPRSRSADEAPSRRARRSAPPPVQAAKPPEAVAKTETNVQIAVFGDTLASYLAKGLDSAFAASPDTEVLDLSRGDSGLVRKDVVDWPKVAEEQLKAHPKVGFAVVMVGVNDRQTLKENGESHDALSDAWRSLYAQRVDALIKVFADRKIPLVWVDLPPVRFDSMSKDLAAINDITRERVGKAGQTYVDVWTAFADDANRFAAVGPDLDGQQAKLRTSDGIHFTSAGARKLAHFADVELKRLIGASGTGNGSQPASIAAVPPPLKEGEPISLDDTAAIDRRITAMLPSLPEPAGIPALPVKASAGPVVPLGRVEASPGGTLMSGKPREGDSLGTRERAMQRGIAPMLQPGRADDFRWPPG